MKSLVLDLHTVLLGSCEFSANLHHEDRTAAITAVNQIAVTIVH